jgi:putative Holliday junction resolvase
VTDLPTHGRILAIDWGTRRIGLAITDESQTLATPSTTLTRRAGKRFPFKRLIDVIAAHQPVGVLFGLPLSSEGGETETTRAIRALAEKLRELTSLPVSLWDERMSTARALGTIREQGGTVRGRKRDVDALAAAVLLQHFLASRRPTI